MKLQLDRMTLDDVGSNPTRLAAAIHDQLGQTTGPVDVHSIAIALDIVEVRAEAITNFEGALITGPERSQGAILININSSRHRQRFTIAHELLHFLSPWHRPTSPDGFQCTRNDMSIINSSERNRHIRQETEANEFAIELLAPRGRLKRYLAGEPDLDRVLEMNTDLVISKQAAARRYVDLHTSDCAVVFSKTGRFRFYSASRDFPSLKLRKGDALPDFPAGSSRGVPSDIEEVEPADWLTKPRGTSLTAQTLIQQNSHAMTLLCCDLDDDTMDEEDAVQRYQRLSGR